MFRSLLRRFTRWLLKEEIARIREDAMTAARSASAVSVKKLTEQLQAIQAIDVDFRDTGKVIVICRIGETDYVKIIDCKPHWRMHEYRNLVRSVEHLYGARPAYFDVPRELGDARQAFDIW